MDFHFILKGVEVGAITQYLFLQKKTLRWMLLNQVPEPTLNLLKLVLSLRPFRLILPNNTILPLSTKFLYYDHLRVIQRQVKLPFHLLTFKKMFFGNNLLQQIIQKKYCWSASQEPIQEKDLHTTLIMNHGLQTTTINKLNAN